MKTIIRKVRKSTIAKNSLWLVILQILNTVVPMITLPYITRILGASQYGIFSISLNWILYLQVLVEFGFGLTGARKSAVIKNQESLNKLFNNILTARIYLLIISFVLINLISFISRVSIDRYLCMILLFTMVVGTTFQLTWLFQGKQDMKFITIVNAIARTVSVGLTFIFVRKEKDLYLYCFLYSITYCISSAISIYIANKKYSLKFKMVKLKEVYRELNEGKYLFMSSAMTKVFSGIGITVLGIFSTEYLVGVYSAIYKIPYILTMFFSPFSQALYPYNSIEFEKSVENGKKSIRKICTPVFILFLALSMILLIFRKIIVQILFGEEYFKYYNVLIPLIIQFIFAMINNFLGIQYLVASGNEKKYTKAFSISCIFILVFNFILGYMYNLYGVAIAALIGEIVLTISILCQIKK